MFNHISLSPLRKSQRLERKSTELTIFASRSSLSRKLSDHSISILMLKSYLSEICKSISSTNAISPQLYAQVSIMNSVLNDCLALSHISLAFYKSAESVLSLVSSLYLYSDSGLMQDLVQMLASVLHMINTFAYASSTIAIPIRSHENMTREGSLQELCVRINRVTPRAVMVGGI
jgi:hypothetical protein